MRIVDVNVLVYATDVSSEHHSVAQTWLKQALRGAEPVAFAELVLLGFARVVTLERLAPRAMSITSAIDLIDRWLAAPAAVELAALPGHLSRMRTLLLPLGRGGNLVPDAHIAALALDNDATVVTYDADFGRFAGVRWERPAA